MEGRTNAATFLEAEVVGGNALNSLLAIAPAGYRVPDPRPNASRHLIDGPARPRKRYDSDIDISA